MLGFEDNLIEVFVMSIISEKSDELSNALDNLRDCFCDFDFLTKDGLTAEDLSDIKGFEKLLICNSELIEFDDFTIKIKKSLHSLVDDLKKSDFDWDDLYDNFIDACEKYDSLKKLKEQIKDNLTGDQEVETVNIYDKEALNDLVMEYLISNNLIYEIEDQEETYYLLNSNLESKINNNC